MNKEMTSEAEDDEEILTFDIPDDALERAGLRGGGRSRSRTHLTSRIQAANREARRIAANIAKLPPLARYCGKPQLYQSLVQYTMVKAFCSALAARERLPVVVAHDKAGGLLFDADAGIPTKGPQ
jgi:hypothetical protein